MKSTLRTNLKSKNLKLKELIPYVNKHKPLCILLVLLMFLTAGLNLLPAQILGMTVDVLSEKDVSGIQHILYQIGGCNAAGCILLLGIVLFTGEVISNIYGILVTHLNNTIIHDLRTDVSSWIFFQKEDSIRPGDMISRISSDVEAVTRVVAGPLNGLMTNLIMLVFSIIIFAVWNFWLAAIAVLTIPFIYCFSAQIARKGKEIAAQERGVIGQFCDNVLEALNNIPVIRNHVTFSQEKAHLRDVSRNIQKLRKQLTIAYGIYWAKVSCVQNLGIVLVLFIGVRSVTGKVMTPGDLLILYTYIQNIYRPIVQLSRFINDILQANSSIERVFALKENFSAETERIYQRENRRQWDNFQRLRISNLCVNRGERVIINQFSLDAEKGQIVLIFGESGYGKSTLLNSLLTGKGITGGNIIVDDHDITREIESYDLFAMGYQENYLFKRPLRENLYYGNMNTQKENRNEKINGELYPDAENYLEMLGIDKIVENEHYTYSGGESRRISIFRTLMQNRPVVLLDEPTSGLDEENVCQLLKVLKQDCRRHTFVIATHDERMVEIADKVYRMKE